MDYQNKKLKKLEKIGKFMIKDKNFRKIIRQNHRRAKIKQPKKT
jgi:hypothetical protein